MAHNNITDGISVILLTILPPPTVFHLNDNGPYYLQHWPFRGCTCHYILCVSFTMMKTTSRDHVVFSGGKPRFIYA